MKDGVMNSGNKRWLLTTVIAASIAAVIVSCGGAAKMTTEEIQGVVMVNIPAGRFIMGTEGGYTDEGGRIRYFPDERPAHAVNLSAYQIGATEITQSLYEKVMGENPSLVRGEELPVTDVSASQALVFCNKLSESAGFEPCYDPATGKCDLSKNGFRLPTEAEWEYACRAGSKTVFSGGTAKDALEKIGWYLGNSGGVMHPVKQKEPNSWGLYDMHGNVWECCYDGFDESLTFGNYTPEEKTDPVGHTNFNLRIIRGGCYNSESSECRSATRGCFWTGGGSDFIGFRVARSIR